MLGKVKIKALGKDTSGWKRQGKIYWCTLWRYGMMSHPFSKARILKRGITNSPGISLTTQT